jgi:hypothetical protein
MIPIITRPTKEETRKYSKLQADCKELEIPYIKAKVIAKVFGKDGKLISDHEQFGHSFTRNFYNCVLSTMGLKNATDVTFGAGLISGKSTAGAIVDGLWSLGGSGGGNFDTPTGYGFADGAGDNTFGIQVGTGTNPESFEDYVLQTFLLMLPRISLWLLTRLERKHGLSLIRDFLTIIPQVRLLLPKARSYPKHIQVLASLCVYILVMFFPPHRQLLLPVSYIWLTF